jgi:hypothetical protein
MRTTPARLGRGQRRCSSAVFGRARLAVEVPAQHRRRRARARGEGGVRLLARRRQPRQVGRLGLQRAQRLDLGAALARE